MNPTGKTGMLGLLAHPIGHVKAPDFMNPAFAERGRNCQVVPMHVKPGDLGSVARALSKIDNFLGIVLSIPHKESMAVLCDDLGFNGQLSGAVNAVRFAGGRMFGDMFDGVGLVKGQRQHGIEVRGRRVLVVGAGGAARAIVFAYGQEGAATVQIANRSVDRAETLAKDARAGLPGFNVVVGAADPTGFDVVVNATPMGMRADDPLPLDINRLSPATDVVDVIALRDTELMQAARDRGCRTIDGLPMALGQIEAFIEFFDPPPIS